MKVTNSGAQRRFQFQGDWYETQEEIDAIVKARREHVYGFPETYYMNKKDKESYEADKRTNRN